MQSIVIEHDEAAHLLRNLRMNLGPSLPGPNQQAQPAAVPPAWECPVGDELEDVLNTTLPTRAGSCAWQDRVHGRIVWIVWIVWILQQGKRVPVDGGWWAWARTVNPPRGSVTGVASTAGEPAEPTVLGVAELEEVIAGCGGGGTGRGTCSPLARSLLAALLAALLSGSCCTGPPVPSSTGLPTWWGR